MTLDKLRFSSITQETTTALIKNKHSSKAHSHENLQNEIQHKAKQHSLQG